MISLRESLQEMMEASAAKALTGNGTAEGQHALVRMTLLLAMLERLDAGGGSWDECDLLPETIPLLSGIECDGCASLPQ